MGLGVLGSQVLLALAREGVPCVGLEQTRLDSRHNASNGGDSRIFRSRFPGQAPFELDYSRDIWRELSAEVRGPVFTETPILTVGHEGDERIDAFLQMARTSSRVDVLAREDAVDRWPDLSVTDGLTVISDTSGGVIRTPAAVTEAIRLAVVRGAVLAAETAVLSVAADNGRFRVDTTTGSVVTGAVIFCTGGAPAMTGARIPSDDALLEAVPRRVVLGWRHRPQSDAPVKEQPTGMRYLDQGAALSFFAPIDDWGHKFNYIARARAQVDRSHSSFELDDILPLLEYSSELLGSFDSGLSRVESYREFYANSPILRSIRPGIAAGYGFSGNGYRNAPWYAQQLIQLALPTVSFSHL